VEIFINLYWSISSVYHFLVRHPDLLGVKVLSMNKKLKRSEASTVIGSLDRLEAALGSSCPKIYIPKQLTLSVSLLARFDMNEIGPIEATKQPVEWLPSEKLSRRQRVVPTR
jgi:hypothetical protein